MYTGRDTYDEYDWQLKLDRFEDGVPEIRTVVERMVENVNAQDFLEDASEAMKARAALRDNPEGERSMATIVNTFNALTGHDLTVSEGWEFMVLLKMVRGRQGFFHADDYVDMASYSALLGEEESSKPHRRQPLDEE
jgi:hypothetical protein